LTLPFSPVRNKNFLSNHWLDQRLPLEPEWLEHKAAAQEALERLQRVWSVERGRVERYGNEAGLEHGLIQPVFEILGWRLKYQTYLDGREPDYALFENDEDLDTALAAGRTNAEFWRSSAMVADAKAWHINLDRPSRASGRREYPPEQIEWYLNHSLCDFGILTNGRLWRLVPRALGPNKPRFQTYLEADLPALLERLTAGEGELDYAGYGPAFDEFMRFYLLFSRHGLAEVAGRSPLLKRAIDGSSEYSVAVGEELKDRVFEALRLAIEGFISHSANGLDGEADLRLCQEQSLLLLYRILFILYGEDRGLLPYRINRTYTNNRSLARRRDDVASRLDQVAQGMRGVDFSRTKVDLWQDLQDLFDLIDRGHAAYGVQAYNGGLFDVAGNSFLAEKALPDWHLARIIDQLGRAPQPGRPRTELYRVDYRDLAIQQLGSVYEGLLELRPRFADADMRVLRSADGKQELIRPLNEPVQEGFYATETTYRQGSIYLATDKGERRRTGSYYTPDHIVDHIVQTSLGELCRQIDTELRGRIGELGERIAQSVDRNEIARLEAQRSALEGSYDDRVLELKVLDPAMGSGHFLIRACQFLAEEIATNPHTRDPGADANEGDEPTIIFWKRRVAEHCLHGVDLNRMAVELAKLALWLETAAADAPLTFLDHHLRFGDSIVGARIGRMGSLPRDRGLLSGQFSVALDGAVPSLLAPLEAIAAMDSATVDDVHGKEELYRRRFLPVQRRFGAIADLWVQAAVYPRSVGRQRYSELIGALSTPKAFERLLDAQTEEDAPVQLQEIAPFHWELAFPHVFLRPDRPRGFDVIIGNPPYDVISAAETDRDVGPLKRFIGIDPSLEPTTGSKNNLYKLFIARSVELLADGGYLSFIVPMAILGDDQASGVRRLLLKEGGFQSIHAFPQKDQPASRVFADAKLSTALFLYRRSGADHVRGASFPTRAHPANMIVEDGEALQMSAQRIGVYDPANLTILTCSRADWDLLVDLEGAKILRLGSLAPFFQGEVNQTNARRDGHLTTRDKGRLVTRGACVCLYQVRDASQGEDLYIDVASFTASAGPETKVHHHRHQRLVLQESSPQNNFRRIIAARLPPGEFCNHTINYTTAGHSVVDLTLILAVLNSVFAEWYFRLGSTNAHVSQYQLKMLPCPRFGHGSRLVDSVASDAILGDLARAEFDSVERAAVALALCGPSATIEIVITRLVEYIETREEERGVISRQQRAYLDPAAAQVQEILDKILLALVGLEGRYALIRERLDTML
jgi:hypothetical protein